MLWLHLSPSHQQPWYQLCRINFLVFHKERFSSNCNVLNLHGLMLLYGVTGLIALPLLCWIYLWKLKTYLNFVISQHWYGRGSSFTSLWRTHISCKANTMSADALAKEGARASAGIWYWQFCCQPHTMGHRQYLNLKMDMERWICINFIQIQLFIGN